MISENRTITPEELCFKLGLIFGNQLLSIYTSDPEVAAYGMGRMKVIFPTYFFDGLMDTACGSIRGLGYSLLPTLVTLTGVCLFRIIWIMTVYRLYPTLFTLYLSYPITWILTAPTGKPVGF